jgi:hypothetical protein
LKEAYLDRIVEQQVVYNRFVADEIARLRTEITQLMERVNSDETDRMTEGRSDSSGDDQSVP